MERVWTFSRNNEIPVTKAPLTKTEPAPLLSEVEAAVKQMKLGKAPGLDGVPGELIRNAGPSSMRAQHTLCTKYGKVANGQRFGKARNLWLYTRQETLKSAPTTGL